MSEKVFVINRSNILSQGTYKLPRQSYDDLCRIFHNDKWSGIVPFYSQEDLIKTAFFVDREEAENNEELLQIIPYAIVTSDNQFLLYRRTKSGGESRLHEKLSIGIGGHVNTTDLIKSFSEPLSTKTRITDVLMHGMTRELTEELNLKSISRPWLCLNGPLVYDGTTKVGRVHLGLIMQVSLKNREEVSLQEEELSSLEWKTIGELEKVADELEEWSLLYLQYRKVLENKLKEYTPLTC